MYIETEVILTPEQLAEVFWKEFDTTHHAIFFSHLAKLVGSKWQFDKQMNGALQHEEMTQGGQEIMVQIGQSVANKRLEKSAADVRKNSE